MTIVAAAIKDDSGKVWSLPAPKRHHHIIHEMYEHEAFGGDDLDSQGFITSEGTFVGRVEAGKIAVDSGQIPRLAHPPYLYTEDLW